MNICNVTNQALTKRKICSFHFQPDCFKDNTDVRILKPDALPTYFVKRYMKEQYIQLATEHGIIHFCFSNYYLLMLSAIN